MAGLRFVLLHSPVLGPMAWKPVAAALAGRGYEAETPAWLRLSRLSDGFYQGLADGLVAQLAGSSKPPLLVAHSAAGALIPAVAVRLPAPPAAVIFVDAILPHPGRSWFDTAPAEMRERLRAGAVMGELPSWDEWWPPGALERLVPDTATRDTLAAELERLPIAYFEEKAPVGTFAGPTGYVQLSGAYDDEGTLAGRYGWPLVRLPLHHLAMLNNPEPVAAALESLAARLTEAAHA